MIIPVHRPFMKRHDMDAVLQCLVADLVKGGETTTHLEDEVKLLFGGKSALALRTMDDAVDLLLLGWQTQGGSTVHVSALADARWVMRAKEAGLPHRILDVGLDGQPEALPEDPGALVVLSEPAGTRPQAAGAESFGGYLALDASEGVLPIAGEPAADFVFVSTEVTDRLTTGGGAILVAGRSRVASPLRQLVAERAPFRLPDLNAALGVTQLKTLPKRLERVRAIAARFIEALGGSRHRVFAAGSIEDRAWHGFPIVVDSPPKDVLQYARKHGVEAVPMFEHSCAGRLEELSLTSEGIDNAMDLFRRTIRFPLYSGLTSSDVTQISRVLSSLP